MRASLLGVVAALLATTADAQDRFTVLRGPGQAITIVSEPAVAERAPALASLIGPHAARVGRWAGMRPPATVFLVADPWSVPDPPGRMGELPGAQIDLERSAMYLWAGLVPEGSRGSSTALTRAISTFLVQTAFRQLAGPRPGVLPVWLVLGLLDDASLAPAAPVSRRHLAAVPFLDLLHPAFNDPFRELLEVHPTLGTAVARALTDDLLARAVPARLGDLVRALRDEEFDDAFEQVYGLSLDAYQKEMARLLGSRRDL